MLPMRTPIHAGTNNDRWFLCHSGDPADAFVFHEPNRPSGGRPSRIELSDFLLKRTGSPEQRALLVMIGSLIETAHLVLTPRAPSPEPGAAGAEPTPGETSLTT